MVKDLVLDDSDDEDVEYKIQGPLLFGVGECGIESILASRGGKRAQKNPNNPKSWGAEQKDPILPQ